jgi:hypothetical protein
MLERVPMGARSIFLTRSAGTKAFSLEWPQSMPAQRAMSGSDRSGPRFLAHMGEMQPLAGREAELLNALASPRGFHEADCRHQRDVEIAK